MDLDPQGQFLLAVGAEMQDVLADRQVDTVLSAAVRPGVGLGVVVEHQGSVHRLAGFGFRHGSMDLAGRFALVLARDAHRVDFVPVGGRQGIVHILDDDGVRLDFLEIAVRQAAPGSGEVRFRDTPPRSRVRMTVPGDAFETERRRARRCGKPSSQVPLVNLPQLAFFQGIQRFLSVEEIVYLRVIVFVISPDHV